MEEGPSVREFLFLVVRFPAGTRHRFPAWCAVESAGQNTYYVTPSLLVAIVNNGPASLAWHFTHLKSENLR